MSDRQASNGTWLTKAMFYEFRHPDFTPSFTTRSEDRVVGDVTYPSLKRIFLEYNDPTEYSFAVDVIGSWDHWQAIAKSYHIGPYVEKWREELEIKLRSQALRAIVETASTEGSKGTTAAKYIAEKAWEKRAGRPSKQEVERQKRIHAGMDAEVQDDAERLGIH